jgi:hypothetical protein
VAKWWQESVRSPLVLLLMAVCAFAQADRAVITGTVKDTTGAVVPGAMVTATHVDTKTDYKTKTTASGNFTVPSLPVGTYQVKVESPGFTTHVREKVLLIGGGVVRLDVQLDVGATQQTVQVVANAQLLEAETAKVSTQVSNRLVDELPVIVNGGVRSPFGLAVYTAGAYSADGMFRIGGGRADQWGMTVDGVAITSANGGANQARSELNSPSVEALTEFTVETGAARADTGHGSGGTATIITKSGTNEFHGSAYEFLRNQDLDARGFFAAKKAVYKQNDFGVTQGGPVWIPKLYRGRDKTFFFLSYEGFRNRVGATPTPYSVPPPEFYTGDMRNWVDSNNKMIPIYDPTTQRLVGSSYVRDPFPNNQIPQSRFDPVSQPILQYVQSILKPNVPGVVPGTSAYVRNNYISQGTTIAPEDKFSIKIDQNLGTKHRLAFFYNHPKSTDGFGAGGPPGLPAPLSGAPDYTLTSLYRGSWDYTISPTLLNRLYGGYNDMMRRIGATGMAQGAPQSSGLPLLPEGWKQKGICIPNYPDCDANFPYMTFGSGDFTTWGVQATNGIEAVIFELHDDMTKTIGRHTLKGGYYYSSTHHQGFGIQNIMGSVVFSPLSTSVPLVTTQATGGGSGFAAFLLGNVSGYSLDTPRWIITLYRTHQMYLQDDWRVSSRLTLNLGLRYEINLAPVEGNNQLSDLDPTLPNPGAGGLPGALIFAGSGPGTQNRRALIDNWYGGIGPRFGFSYALNSKTSIRGAATRSFSPVTAVASASHNLGFVERLVVTDPSQGLTPLWQLKDGAPAWTAPPNINPSAGNGANVPYYNGDGADREGSELDFSLNIQRQVTATSVVEVGYLGTLASDFESELLALNQINFQNLPPQLSPFTAAGRTLLNSLIGSPAAIAAGISAPFATFNTLWGNGATVAQALRPYPQYGTVDTYNGGGDRIGHSTYHSMMVKFQKRYSGGFTFQGSYVFSKLLTNSDLGTSSPLNNYNLSLEKSIASYDQTHSLKLTYVYELPFGKGKKYLSGTGVASSIIGGWHFSGIQEYSSGEPVALGTTISVPIFNGSNRPTVSTYDGWRAPIAGGQFDPAVDRFLQPASFFGTQPTNQLGNATRYNPKLRYWPTFNENVSLARTFRIKEALRLEFRGEAFNLLNRTAFGPLSGATSLQNANFGLWRTQSNSQRRLQLAMKLYW